MTACAHDWLVISHARTQTCKFCGLAIRTVDEESFRAGFRDGWDTMMARVLNQETTEYDHGDYPDPKSIDDALAGFQARLNKP